MSGAKWLLGHEQRHHTCFHLVRGLNSPANEISHGCQQSPAASKVEEAFHHTCWPTHPSLCG